MPWLSEQLGVFRELFGHRIVFTSPSSHSKEKDPSWKHPHILLYVVRVVHRIVSTLPSSHFKEKDPSLKQPHTLLYVVHVVCRIGLTLPNPHFKEKDQSWKHPHTLLCVVCVVHRIVLTSPSSHSKEKDPSWKHPHTLLCVVCVPLWFTWIMFCKFLLFSHIKLPKRRFILLGGIQILAPAPYASPSPFLFSDSSRFWTTSPGSPG